MSRLLIIMAVWITSFSPLCRAGLNYKAECNDMGNPNSKQADAPNLCIPHGNKSDCHDDGHCTHNPQLCFPRHPLSPHKGLQITFIEFCAPEPPIQASGTFSKAES